MWKATRQDTVTTSTTEAELLALGEVGREAIGLKRIFDDLRFVYNLTWNLRCDNAQTIRLVTAQNERIQTRLRHVDIHHLWVRQEYQRGTFKVTYLPTNEMPADGLTKALSRERFERFRRLLNLGDLSTRVSSSEPSYAVTRHGEPSNGGWHPEKQEYITSKSKASI
jgi:hypothetical protein